MKPTGNAWLGRTWARGPYHALKTYDVHAGYGITFCGETVRRIVRGRALDRTLADPTARYCETCVKADWAVARSAQTEDK